MDKVAGPEPRENTLPPDLAVVFERLYPELKRLARSKLNQLHRGETLTATALVAEAYVKLVQAEALSLQDRGHFFVCAARAMRHIIIDNLRARLSHKRGGGLDALTLDEEHLEHASTPQQLLDLDRALDELNAMSPRQCKLVELKFFAGLSIRDIAGMMDLPERTAWREWERARAFLLARLSLA